MLQSPLSGWPSGLRRQTHGRDPSATKVAESILVHKCGRGFKSHSWHLFFFHIPLNGDLNKKKTKGKLRQRGIEPRSTAWKATMLTITPLTPLAFMGHKTRTNVIQILLTKAHHLSVLSFTVVMYCHFNSFAYWCNGKNILMTTKFYWHRSKCVIKE